MGIDQWERLLKPGDLVMEAEAGLVVCTGPDPLDATSVSPNEAGVYRQHRLQEARIIAVWRPIWRTESTELSVKVEAV